MLPWEEIETVFLDLDGVLIDLCFDHELWRQVLPEAVAQQSNKSLDEVRRELYGGMRPPYGIHNYCVDYWSTRSGCDVRALHRARQHRMMFRAGTRAFLEFLRKQSCSTVIVTNAHPYSLQLKDQATGICKWVHESYSAHEFGISKDYTEFWSRLADRVSYTPSRSLYIDDRPELLEVAEKYGIKHLVTVEQPDSTNTRKIHTRYQCISEFNELMR